MDILMLWYQHDWGLYGRRYEMIARTWVQEHPRDRLLIAEPPLNPWIWARETARALRAGDRVLIRYWFSRLRSLFAPLDKESERLWVLRPFLWWPFRSTGDGSWTRFSFSRAWAQLRRFMTEHGWKDALLWAYPPHAFVHYAVERYKTNRLCVDLVDDNTQYQSLSNGRREEYKSIYADLLRKADVIFSVSPALTNQQPNCKKRIIHIPNAVSPASCPSKSWKLPPLPTGTRVCYVGHLDERLDAPLLRKIIERLPNVQFIFIGSFDAATKTLWDRDIGAHANVHCLGTIPSPYISSVLAEMDICMLPHRITPLTESMDPMKLYTYIAAKKPVIATRVNIEPSLRPWVRCVDSAEEFETALNEFQHHTAPLPDPPLQGWPERVAVMAGHLA